MKNEMWRHGDVQIVAVDRIPNDVKKLDRKWLALGEVTGHSHKIDVGDLFETKDGKLYLKVDNKTTVSHEEHKNITLESGCYFIGIKRQYSPDGWSAVRD